MTTDPTKPTVQEADVAALIERVRRQHWHKSHWRNDQCTEMCGCGGPWPCDVLSLASALERAQAEVAAVWAVMPTGARYLDPPDGGDVPQAEQVRRMREDAERAQADTARLDWLERMANEPGGLLLHDGSETGRVGLGLRPGLMDRTLRAAIDAATSQAPSAT